MSSFFRCTNCDDERANRDSPICPGLEGKGEPHIDFRQEETIPLEQLPRYDFLLSKLWNFWQFVSFFTK